MQKMRAFALLFLTPFVFIFYSVQSSCTNNISTELTDTLSTCKDTVINNPTDRYTLSILIAGDIMQHDSQINSAFNSDSGNYDYNPVFAYIKPLIEKYDIAIANLECTFGGKPYKGYPQFSAPDELAPAIQNAGFDILMTSNNHSCDKRKKGIVRTIKVLDSLNIPHLGTYLDSASHAEETPMIIQKNGFKLALLNYTYGTNGIPVPKPTIVSLIDTIQIKKDILEAKDSLPDFIMVLFHWGLEYKRLPNAKQKKIENFCYQHGADFVIGSHPHVIQPMQKKIHPFDSTKQVITVYSLGNYVSNQRKRYTDGGAMIGIHLSKPKADSTHTDTIVPQEYSIDSAGYYLTWVYKEPFGTKKIFHIMPAAQYENDTTLIKSKVDQKALQLFISDSRTHLNKYNIEFPEFIPKYKKSWYLSKSNSNVVKEERFPDAQSENVYKIQFLASSKKFDIESLPQDWQKLLSIEKINNGVTRYMLGSFSELKPAKKLLDEVKLQGYDDAFMVYFKDGKREIVK